MFLCLVTSVGSANYHSKASLVPSCNLLSHLIYLLIAFVIAEAKTGESKPGECELFCFSVCVWGGGVAVFEKCCFPDLTLSPQSPL